jgi:DNA-directed RNA polymerase specialized sigma24 family protein
MSDDPELVHLVRRIVSGMEPATREIFLLSCVAERSYLEIAEWLALTPAEVEERLADAILALARGLQGPGEG